MVTNQDGLGHRQPCRSAAFERAHRFILDAFASQGVDFEQVFICPHCQPTAATAASRAPAWCASSCAGAPLDLARSYMIGDRDTDLEFAAQSRYRAACGCGSTAARRRPGPRSPRASWLGAPRRTCRRTTRETDIEVDVDLIARAARCSIATGIGFFDHMLEQIAKHGGFALRAAAARAICTSTSTTRSRTARWRLGAALREALGDKRGIARYGFLLPMDEAEAQVALDLSGRPYFVWEGRFNRERVGELPTELVPHFFRSLAEALGAALHLSVRGENTHHMIEACFKGVGRSLRQAIRARGQRTAQHQGRAVSAARRRHHRQRRRQSSPRCNSRWSGSAPTRASSARPRGASRGATHVILPGVGAAADAMARLTRRGLGSTCSAR